jgi:hypothetical protein
VENINTIAEELKELGSSLAGIPPMTPYAVPPGFFEAFPSMILSQVMPADKPEFGVTTHPYQVPEDYFQQLPEIILKRVKADNQSVDEELSTLSPLLRGVDRKLPYTIPDNYFSQMSSELLAGTSAVNDDALSPMMEALKHQNVYSVPQGYFESLPAKLLKQVSGGQAARVVKGNFGRKLFQYAAAAVIAGVLFTVGFFTLNNGDGESQIVSAKNLQEKAAQTSDEDILTYLSNQPAPLADVQLMASGAEIKEDAILDMLADVSDEELQHYVQTQSDVKLMIN